MAFFSFPLFTRALLGRCAGLLCALALLLCLAAAARAEDHELLVTWENPSPSVGGLKRIAGDADNWTFTVKLAENLEWVRGPEWTYPRNSGDEDWGAFSGGADGASSLSWSSPLTGGGFRVGVKGRIRKTGGKGGGGVAEEKEVDSAWSGEVADVWEWKPAPDLPSGTIASLGLSRGLDGKWLVGAGQRVSFSVFGVNTHEDRDTRTNLAGKTEIKSGDDLRYKWSMGGTSATGPFPKWTAPTNVPPGGTTVTITCTIDDSYDEGATGVDEPDTGTRNDAPVELASIEVLVLPTVCGHYKHQSWAPQGEVTWIIDANGNPQPTPPGLIENATWEDSCAATTKPPIADARIYFPAQGDNDILIFEDGILYRQVRYTASSWYGGPDAPVLTSRHAMTRTWSASPAISGGAMVAVAEGTIVKPGEGYTFAVSAAKDKDTWMRNGVSGEESDGVRYTWSSSSGSFEGETDSPSVRWVAPAQADVPAGTGLTVTITCVVDDQWDGEATGVAGVEGDTGTRNDGASPPQTATIQVQRAPCGRWQHKSWQASELEWRTDSNGDPEPIAPKDATEIVQWVDECGGPAKDDVERKVPYTLVSDGPVEIEGVWNRKVEYRAYSTCAGGTDSELLSGERALPRHWSEPGELDGGTMSVELTGSETAGLVSPGVVTPGSTTALILPSGGGVSLNVSEAKDTDTYSYWNVPEETADDAIIYKWTVTDEDGNETELDTTAATSSWSGTAAGTYVITGTVDDAWSVDEDGVKESGVTAPDLGERNDDEIVYVVAVTVVAKEWSSGKEIGFRPAEDESGERIEPVEWIEDGKLLLPKLGDETKAIPGEAVELEVATASDWDAWERAGIDGGIALDGPLTYKWTLTGGKFRIAGDNGTFTEATEVTGRKATWIAPAVAEGEANSFTVTCTIDDGTQPRVVDPETGSHDDQELERTVSIEVVPSYWAPEDKSIGFEPTLGEDEQPIKPYKWSENGRITAPIDQRVEDEDKELLVTPGESVTATIEPAQDWDTLTTLEGKTIERDQPLTYVWSSGRDRSFSGEGRKRQSSSRCRWQPDNSSHGDGPERDVGGAR